jgi:hypothetical protein
MSQRLPQAKCVTKLEVRNGPTAIFRFAPIAFIELPSKFKFDLRSSTGGTGLPIVYSEEADAILSVGIWLGPEHRNWALTKEQALAAIDRLRDANFILLGGDVLNEPEKNFSHAYDNWHFERSIPPLPSDPSSSALKASYYVRDYPVENAYFVLVPHAA